MDLPEHLIRTAIKSLEIRVVMGEAFEEEIEALNEIEKLLEK